MTFDEFNEWVVFGKSRQPKTQEELKQVFYKSTDYLWGGGSYSNLSQEQKNSRYERMDKIAKEIGYIGFKLENYINTP